ncbi:hypothetical protein PV963_16855 [Streptomyces coeruleorubidus]|uniref:hypothetical protein n=1 Tax=Streptomyces coeruleorubidus TaxID=116188 RepID=UPI00237FD4D2|nr:hypothetical protein [Streptomyces coeruleorubidus]WDV51925.1 hypothetical protein PV963_16855 [Streptomyces coeruleorubidus]
MERPWWKRPAALWGGVVAVAVASFFLGGVVLGSDSSSGAPSEDSWVQNQVDGQSQNNQQNNQPAGISAAQRSQILSGWVEGGKLLKIRVATGVATADTKEAGDLINAGHRPLW